MLQPERREEARRQGVKRGLAFLALAVALAATQPATAQGVPAIENPPAHINDLLADYSRAWRTKDAALLRRTLTPTMAETESKSLANAKDVPFSSFVVRPTTQFSGNLASKRVRVRYRRAEDVATYHVIEESRIGNETGTFTEEGAFTFIRTAEAGDYDGWRLASKGDLDVLGFFSPYHLWDDGPVVLVTSERFTMLTHPETAQRMRPILQEAERAYDHDQRFWPDPLTDHFVILVPSTTEELGRLMHETVDLDKFVAFVGAGANRERGWAPTGPRVFVHLSHIENYGPQGKFEIFAHELIHAITRTTSGPNVSAWVEEGLANFGGGNGARPRVATTGPAPDVFPTDDLFVTGSVRDIQSVYDQAQVAIQVLDEKFGRDGLAAFYKELGSRRVTAGTEEYHIRAAVKDALGWSYDEWVAAWRKAL